MPPSNDQLQQQLQQKIESLEATIKSQQEMIAKIYKSSESTRKMILWTGIITVALIVLPAIGLVFVIPSFIGQYSQIQNLGL